MLVRGSIISILAVVGCMQNGCKMDEWTDPWIMMDGWRAGGLDGWIEIDGSKGWTSWLQQ